MLFLDQGLAGLLPLGAQEGVRHGATDQERVHAFEQAADDLDLVRHLGAAEDRNQRALRRRHHLAEVFALALQQKARCTLGYEGNHSDRRSMRAVRGAERVVHVDISQPSQRARELLVVLLLGGVEAQVFEQRDLTGAQSRHQRFGLGADAIGRHRHVGAESVGEQRADRFQAEGWIGLAFRPAEVRREHHAAAVLQRVANRRQRCVDVSRR